ncbi:MAG: GAF domain-containing protein [Anaerolineae bacterium]|nr:GAF domain-containing protein [Anaerolineae bacterium]
MDAGIASGLILALVGLVLIALVWVLTRWVLSVRPTLQAAIESPSKETPKHGDAVLVIHSGGRIDYANATAREWFELTERETPNLERIARRARPSDKFWELCAAEGQAHFSIAGKMVEGISYQVPGKDPLLLLSLRQLELSTGIADAQDISGSVLRIITDFGQAIAENLNLDATLSAVIENVERLVLSDILEVKVWEKPRQSFISYRIGVADGKSQLERSDSTRFGNYSAYIAEQEDALFVSDTQTFEKLRFLEETDQFSIRSYIGIPLHAGGELVGLLEVGQIAADAYAQEDQDILQMIAGQAAVAIRNALLYEKEQQRTRELTSLANLAQAAGSLQDREEFFSTLVKNIRPLFDVKILGFLLYDEDRRMLEGQVPFEGMPSHIVSVYRSEIVADSVAEEIINAQQALLTIEAAKDQRWEELHLQNIAQAASLHESALVPLISSGRFLGYLQLSNHIQGSQEFNENEVHLMNVVANQAATIIDNASLVLQTRQRARRAETMRRVASLVSSSATLDETLHFSIRELVQLIDADTAVLFLLDEEEGGLNAHEKSIYGIPAESIGKFSKIYLEDPQFRFTVTGSQQSFRSGNVQADPRITDFYRPMADASEMQSALAVPLVIREHGIGEIFLGSRFPDFFTGYDIQAAITVSEHLAIAVGSSRAAAQTDESLRLRVDQLTALSRVSRELNSNLNLKHLLKVVYDEGLRTTKADCGTITIFDQNIVEDDLPKSILSLGCAQGSQLTEAEETVARSGKALFVDDFSEGPHPSNHEGVRSALIAPIAYQGKTVGLFHLHSMSPHHFDEETLDVVKTLAIQAAIAFGNAYRYEEQLQHGKLLERQAKTLTSLFDTTSSLELEQPLADSLQVISRGICDATPFDEVLISIYDPKTEMMQYISGEGISEDNFIILQEANQPFNSIQQLLKPEFQLGRAYYIPAEKPALIQSKFNNIIQDKEYDESEASGAWHSDDKFLFVLYDQGENPLGMISLDKPRDGFYPDQSTVEAVEVFAAQAALLISNQTRLEEFSERADALSAGLERQRRLLKISQNDLPTMLHKDMEQTITIHKLDGASDRTRAGLQITEEISKQVDASSALQALGREILTHMGFMTAFIAENTIEGPHLLQTMGDLPPKINPDALFGQRNPLRTCLQTGEVMLVMNLEGNDEWRETPLLSAMQSKSFIALPIIVEEETVAAVLAVSRDPMAILTSDDEQVYYQISRQASIILQNIHLLTSVRRRFKEVNLLLDFSRTLDDLSPSDITKALLKSALNVISAAHAGIVLLWNESTERLEPEAVQNYTDNASMEKISYHSGEALPGTVFAERRSRLVSEVNFARDYTLSASSLHIYREAVGGRLPISSLLVPIQTGDYCLGVLVLDNFNKTGAFNKEDDSLLLSLAQQVALSLQNVDLLHSTEERATQLESLTEVTATINSSLQSEELIPSLLSQLERVIPYDRAMLWLYDEDKLQVAASRGFPDDISRVGMNASQNDNKLLNEMLQFGKTISVPDKREDKRVQTVGDSENLSWLGIPLLYKGEVIGAMMLDKQEANFFTLTHTQVGATFAGQAAVAIENARLYQSTLSTADRLGILNSVSAEISAILEPEKIYDAIYEAAKGLMSVESFEIALFDKEENLINSVYHVVQNQRLPEQEISLDSNPIGKVIATKASVLLQNIVDIKSIENAGYEQVKTPFSIVAVPMQTGDQVVGVLSAQSSQNSTYTAADQQILSTLGNQAIIAIQNGNLFAETQRLTENLEQRVMERTAELNQEQRNTSTLLDILTEVSASLDLDLALNRTLALLNDTVGAEQGTVMLVHPEDNLLHFRAGYGYLSKAKDRGKGFTLKVGEGLAGWVVENRDAVLIDDLDQDERWIHQESDLERHRSAVAAPLMVGEDVIGVLLVFNREVNFFSPEQLSLIKAIAGQVAVAINNANLYKLIREQAERLGSMLRNEQEEASRSHAILEAVADGVLVTDNENRIGFINASAERILGIESDKVISQTLKEFSGLFGKAANIWHQIIREWSDTPTEYQEGDTYAEQLELENGRIVLVHLAPVMLRGNDFLGTVSIFRDITHEVEVDRLKSEFVATVSHELRTPMTSIRGYVDVLLMGAAGALTENQVHFLEIIRNNTERLNVLVTDLLDISRIESGRITLAPQPVSLEEITKDVMDNVQSRSKNDEKTMEFSLEITKELPTVNADPERLRQIINNLVENAYHYTPENGHIMVSVHEVNGGDEVQINVQDDGVGISIEDQEQVFERFYRGEDPLVLATPGTGLGLAIVKQLVEMHKGRIWAESSGKVGEGSIFSFTLPVYKEF